MTAVGGTVTLRLVDVGAGVSFAVTVTVSVAVGKVMLSADGVVEKPEPEIAIVVPLPEVEGVMFVIFTCANAGKPTNSIVVN